MKSVEMYMKINVVLVSAIRSIWRDDVKDPRSFAKTTLEKVGELGKELDELESEDSKWNVIHDEMKNSTRLYREDIVNGEIVQLCSSLKFLATIYDDKTAEVLKQAHDTICAFVNADCLLRVFFASDMLKKYEEMKSLERILARRAARCTKREEKIDKILKKLEADRLAKESVEVDW